MLSNENPNKLYFNIDGDDLRDLFKIRIIQEGRINIRLGMSLAAYLINKNVFQLFLVSPYISLREEFKSKYNVLEVYIHTSEIRGREEYFAKSMNRHKIIFLIWIQLIRLKRRALMKYSMFIGRWQPWHKGHRWLIDQRLNQNKNV